MDLGLAMVAASALSGGASFLGGQSANSANAEAQRLANFQNAAEAQKQRDWQEHMYERSYTDNRNIDVFNKQWTEAMSRANWDFQREQFSTAADYNTFMSNTQMQRRMADLKAAGLNPMLAYTQGGASSPQVSPMSGGVASGSGGQGGAVGGGATATAGRAHIENVLGPAVSSAVQGAMALSSVRNMAAQTELTTNQARTELARAVNVEADTALRLAQGRTEGLRPNLVEAQTGQARASATQSAASARALHTQADLAPVIAGAQTARDWASVGELGAREAHTRQDIQANQTYGRSRHSPAEMISQPLDAIRQSFMRELYRIIGR